MGEWSAYFEDFPGENPAPYGARSRFEPERRSRATPERQRINNHKLDALLRLNGVSPAPKPSTAAKA